MNFVDNGWTGDVDWRVNCIKALIKAKEGKSKNVQQGLDKNIYIIERMIEADEMLKFASAKKIQEFIDAYRSLLTKDGLFDKLQYAEQQVRLKVVELEKLKAQREGILKDFVSGSDLLNAWEAWRTVRKD